MPRRWALARWTGRSARSSRPASYSTLMYASIPRAIAYYMDCTCPIQPNSPFGVITKKNDSALKTRVKALFPSHRSYDLEHHWMHVCICGSLWDQHKIQLQQILSN